MNKKHGSSIRLGLIAGCLGVALLATPQAAQAKDLTIASFGGQLDEAFKKALQPYLEKNKINIRWVPGTATENAAKVVATKDNPEYDLVLLENITYDTVSRQNLLAKFDPKNMMNYADLAPTAKLARQDGMPVGFYYTGIFYNPGEFTKRGWAVPTSWNDLFRPEFCKHIGVLHPNISYGLHTLMMIGGGNIEGMEKGIARFGELKNCIATMEPSASKLEEKIQLGEYLIGAHGTIRVAPLMDMNYPIRFTIPKEGAILAFSVVTVPKNSPNLKLSQDIANWLVGPEAQKVFMEMAFYAPVNSKVEQSARLREFGVPTGDQADKIIKVDEEVVVKKRRDWVRQVERAMTR